MPDPMTLDEYFQTEAGQQLQTDMAGMSDAENATMMSQLQSAADAGDLHEGFNTDGMFLDSQVAEGARQDAEQLQSQQAEAIADGDWDKAHDLAQQAEYSMQEVQDHGGDVAQAELDQNSADLANTSWAEYHQEIADDNAVTAASYAEAGDGDHAAQYGEIAADQGSTAADFGALADQGGTYADHTVDTSASFDASASSASFDSSSASPDAGSAVDTSATTTE
jgi:hypothetical protein